MIKITYKLQTQLKIMMKISKFLNNKDIDIIQKKILVKGFIYY